MAQHLISVVQYCRDNGLDQSVIHTFYEHSLVEFEVSDGDLLVPEEQLSTLEQLLRLHQDLGINPPGLGVVKELLERLSMLENELRIARRKLNFFEFREQE